MPYYIVIRERAAAWDWSAPMRQQAEWPAHAAFMNGLANKGFIAAGGPLGGEDNAARLLHVLNAPVEMEAASIERIMSEDPWTPMGLLKTVSIEPWTVLLGGFDCPECGTLSHRPKK